MAKLVSLVAVLTICASMLISVSSARDIAHDDISHAQSPFVDDFAAPAPSLQEQCKISQSCGSTLAQMLVTKTYPNEQDVECCQEFVETSKYCWDKAMEIIEDPTIPQLSNLHPWADNAWNKCLKLLTNSPAEAPDNVSPAQVPSAFPEQCMISKSCEFILARLLVTKSMPSEKNSACCQEIVETSKYCWDTAMKMIDDPTIPTLTNLYPWADDAWNKCVSLTL